MSIVCVGRGGERDGAARGNDEQYAVVVKPRETRTAQVVQTYY